METISKSLLDVANGEKARIIGFSGGTKSYQKLTQYGIFQGDILEVLRSAPFEGPIMLSINGREIAIGRGIAATVEVELLV